MKDETLWLTGDKGGLLTWAIYDKESRESDGWAPDLTAPEGLEDGVYEVEHFTGDRLFGIEIKDGKFLPIPTMKTIYLLELQHLNRKIAKPSERYSYGDLIDHVFLERLTWNGKCFEIFLGS